MPARFLFFAGKGGVGKTSMACATAVHLADQGTRTLIVTTDPASNLADVFGQPIGHRITAIEGVRGLFAMEIDPDRATQEYKDRALGPVRAFFPAEVVRVMEEQMNSPCTAEIAAFDRFTDFIDSPSGAGGEFAVVVFDTAPTGHTLRLLELPAEWSRTIEEAARTGGQTCVGPAAAIQAQKAKYDRALQVMRDPGRASFTFVLLPEASSVRETRRAVSELKRIGIQDFHLIINGIVPFAETVNPFFRDRSNMQQANLDPIQEDLPYPARKMFLLDGEIAGVPGLRRVAGMLVGADADYRISRHVPEPKTVGPAIPSTSAGRAALPRILPVNGRRTLFFAGKGGVGKTVISCVTAAWVAQQRYRTLLLSTDPAEHLSDVLETQVTAEPAPYPGIPDLYVTKIDAVAAADAYKARILADAASRGRSPEAVAAMAEELNSPCTEEMAAFDKFIEYASQDGWDVIVFDTAPTGHTLRLLELPVDWSRQLEVKIYASVDTAAADEVAKKRFGDVIEMMRDPARCTFAYVMYPESTPIVESARAMDELRTVGIEPGLVVANQVLPAEVCITPYAAARRKMQDTYLAEMRTRFNVPILLVPLLSTEVSGIDMLVDLGRQVYGEDIR
jgi:arsenite-transporting ATPase